MTAYRFRVKFDPDPRALWRDLHVGADRTLDELQSTINETFGLDDEHYWFFGVDERYWNSDVLYLSPQEDESAAVVDSEARLEAAGETTVGELAQQLDIEQYDRICYLYDYDDEWRLYGICKEIYHDEPSNMEPTVGNTKGDPLEQYPDAETGDSSLPARLETFPETPVPIANLDELEARDGVDHVISLLSVETDAGAVSERVLIQYDDVGYLLEHYPSGWVLVEQVDGDDRTEAELLGELAERTREYHAKLAELACSVVDDEFDDETVEAMNAELTDALEARGYGHL